MVLVKRPQIVSHNRGDWSTGDDKAAYVERDFAFHKAIIAVSGNPALEGLYTWFSTAVGTTIAATLGGDLTEPDMDAHRSIIVAIASGNADRAEGAVRTFMGPILAECGNL